MASEARKVAQELAGKISRMDQAERQQIADRLAVVINPEGRALSPLNTILLAQQSGRADLTMVGGFKQWIKHGRCVRKGEKSIGFIRVPMHLKDKHGKTDSNGDPARKLWFRFVAVFDVSQTDELGVSATA